MIIYHATLGDYLKSCSCEHKDPNFIANRVSAEMNVCGLGGHDNSIFESWVNSLPALANVLDDSKHPDGIHFSSDLDVAIEYEIDSTKRRIYFVIWGDSSSKKPTVVLVELKQWSRVWTSPLDDHVQAITNHQSREDALHPSLQVYNYEHTLINTSRYLQDHDVDFFCCSYLHNLNDIGYMSTLHDLSKFGILIDPSAGISPEFDEPDAEKLRIFLSNHVRSKNGPLLFDIDNKGIAPSKALIADLVSAVSGQPFYGYDDDQAYTFDRIMYEYKSAMEQEKPQRKTIIVRGGPGTGKSVIALNLLGSIIKLNNSGKKIHNAVYVTQNAAPRKLFIKVLSENQKDKLEFEPFFQLPLSLVRDRPRSYSCVLVDEAHRVYDWKGGVGVPKGVNVLEKIFDDSIVNVFFIDDDQAVTKVDYATPERIKKMAAEKGSIVIETDRMHLKTQFRCTGGDQYIAFIRSILGYSEAGKPQYDANKVKYDFQVFSDASAMRDELRQKNALFQPSRMVAGYTFEWVSKKPETQDQPDIILDDGKFQAKWNLRLGKQEDYSWVYDPDSFEQVGCIHTCQGIDLQYCGVIIGPDMTYENGHVCFHHERIAKSDTASGARNADDDLGNRLVRNTYNVLLTRGMRGTYVYCCDKALGEYLAGFAAKKGN